MPSKNQASVLTSNMQMLPELKSLTNEIAQTDWDFSCQNANIAT